MDRGRHPACLNTRQLIMLTRVRLRESALAKLASATPMECKNVILQTQAYTESNQSEYTDLLICFLQLINYHLTDCRGPTHKTTNHKADKNAVIHNLTNNVYK